jgi:hypothetical protein
MLVAVVGTVPHAAERPHLQPPWRWAPHLQHQGEFAVRWVKALSSNLGVSSIGSVSTTHVMHEVWCFGQEWEVPGGEAVA